MEHGTRVYIRTVAYATVGTITDITPTEIVLTDASTVFDSGALSEFFSSGGQGARDGGAPRPRVGESRRDRGCLGDRVTRFALGCGFTWFATQTEAFAAFALVGVKDGDPR